MRTKAERINLIEQVLMRNYYVAVSAATIAEDIGEDWCTKPDGSPYGAQVYALLSIMPSARRVARGLYEWDSFVDLSKNKRRLSAHIKKSKAYDSLRRAQRKQRLAQLVAQDAA